MILTAAALMVLAVVVDLVVQHLFHMNVKSFSVFVKYRLCNFLFLCIVK